MPPGVIGKALQKRGKQALGAVSKYHWLRLRGPEIPRGT
jgi:hypothetical protein